MVYKYGDFIIKKRYSTNDFYTVFKDGQPFSSLAFTKIEDAKRIIDKVFMVLEDVKENITEKPKTIELFCQCGCKNTFIKNVKSQKIYINGHNTKFK